MNSLSNQIYDQFYMMRISFGVQVSKEVCNKLSDNVCSKVSDKVSNKVRDRVVKQVNQNVKL
jgi:hypothetical protein